MKVFVNARVLYCCYLTDNDSKKVRSYAKKHNMNLCEAVDELYADNKIDIYADSTESDFSTENIESVEEDNA